jgi:pyruvate dehydrogenase E1 component beta subunit
MPIELKMPALSPTMEEGTLAKWLVKEGDTVTSGTILAEIETDKATMEFEAIDEGIVAKILVSDGTDEVKVGTVIAILTGEDEDTEGVAGGAREVAAPEDNGHAIASTPAEEAQAQQATVQARPKEGQEPASLKVEPEVPAGTEMARQTVREALRDAMAEEMRSDDRVFVMGEEVAEYQGAYKVTQGLLDEFGPRRVIDTPITEYGFAGVGTGAAMGGLRPVVEFMTFNFAMQAIDHIINSAAKTNYMSGGQMRCPIVFRGPNGAASRVAAQHSQNFGPWYANVPGLIVISPYSAADAKGLLKARSAARTRSCSSRTNCSTARRSTFRSSTIMSCRSERRGSRGRGTDVTLVSYSIGVGVALDAASQLAEQGIEAEVIDLRTLRPLDKETVLRSLAKTNRLVCVEEGWPVCSISSRSWRSAWRMASTISTLRSSASRTRTCRCLTPRTSSGWR